MNAKKLTQLALLSTVALIIFIVELRIPNLVPIPGVKLGLANIVTVYAVYRYKPSEVFLIVMVRISGFSFRKAMAFSIWPGTLMMICLDVYRRSRISSMLPERIILPASIMPISVQSSESSERL